MTTKTLIPILFVLGGLFIFGGAFLKIESQPYGLQAMWTGVLLEAAAVLLLLRTRRPK